MWSSAPTVEMTGVCHLERSEAESKDPRSVAMVRRFFVVLLLRMTGIFLVGVRKCGDSGFSLGRSWQKSVIFD